ncbi:MAG: type II secretion system F family protein [Bacteroidia bacterium]|nr:type II secretion system F family protein [Bacteroidia bacterium]
MKNLQIGAGQSFMQAVPVPKNIPKSDFLELEIRLGPVIPLLEKQRIYHLLAILLRSGLGILDSIQVVAEQTARKEIRQVLTQMSEEVEGGKSLSAGLETQPAIFSTFEVYNLRMGEQTGRMAEVLENMAVFFDKKVKLRRKIIQSLSYPASVVAISVLVLAFMLVFVVPMFRDIFGRFDAELPAITQIVIKIADVFSSYIWWILLIAGSGGAAIFSLRKRLWLRKRAAAILLKTPLLGNLVLKLHLSRLAYSLGMLLNARVTLDQALFLTADMIPFYPIQIAVVKIRKAIVEGSTLYDAVRRCEIFPVFFVQIVRVGEQAARLDEMMSQLARNMEEETEMAVQQLTQFIEPLLIVFLGGMVALILVAMYLPMFELGNAIG